MHTDHQEQDILSAGGLALIPIGTANQFFLQPEVLFYGAGETGKDSDFKNGDRNANGYNAVYANNYISVPVYFKAYFSEAPFEFLQWQVLDLTFW